MIAADNAKPSAESQRPRPVSRDSRERNRCAL